MSEWDRDEIEAPKCLRCGDYHWWLCFDERERLEKLACKGGGKCPEPMWCQEEGECLWDRWNERPSLADVPASGESTPASPPQSR